MRTTDPGRLLLPLAAFALGIALGRSWPGAGAWALAAGIGGGAELAALARGFGPADRRLPAAAAAVLLFTALGQAAWNHRLDTLRAASADLVALSARPGRHVLTGQVLRAPVATEDGVLALVAVAALHDPAGDRPLHGRLALAVRGLAPEDLEPGAWIRFACRLKPIRNHRAPGAFDRENRWATRDVRVAGFVDHPLRLLRAAAPAPSGAISRARLRLERTRARLLGALRARLPQPARGLAVAMTLGEKAELEPAVREAFARTGIGHLLAVSGLHLAMVALFAGGGLAWCLRRSRWCLEHLHLRKTATAAALAAAAAYAGLAGFSPSALRALLMVGAFGTALLADRPQAPLNALALAGWGLLLLDPCYLFDVSFQLSFAAVFFLVLAAPLLGGAGGDADETPGWFRRRARACVLVTLVATAATAPLVAWHFQRFSPLGLAANLAAVPVVGGLVLPALLLAALLWPVAPGAAALAWKGLAPVLSAVAALVERAAALPGAAAWIPRPGILPVTAYAALLAAGLVALGRGARRRGAISLAGALLLAAGWAAGAPNPAGRDLVLHVLDVGQGTSQVVELPGGKVVVVDGGGRRGTAYDMGARVVAPFLRTLGRTRIDVLVASHPEADHVGGLPALVEQFDVGEIWANGDRSRDETWRLLMEAAAARKVPVRVWRRPGRVTLGGAEVEVLPAGGCSRRGGRNARSLVLRVQAGPASLLLPGDIDRRREACLVESGLPPADILVMPHHGSRSASSPAFLARVRPRVAVCSAGWRNAFGHPAPEVLARYRRAGIPVLRTDRNGTVTARWDGTAWTVTGSPPGPFFRAEAADQGAERVASTAPASAASSTSGVIRVAPIPSESTK
ncbi:DNA internalization-related competence protein ComEC/Rec2 [Dissulfurirhabdus thermomarina]|uniref:DNA internalization-related competence protein ComEC/Rec2 n=1 Tax=Dissulfurirhabdus thermomarina TaxID=1765737 RepID=A0A6N9TR41_DISTH|nr:DNA internalization-related competence protein ComEC/Rec2 [Dissulfurirhabdus thermomarina]NDY42214.1 DNA internalization-related competence protein ComEC/Rec2 [Dissulfurirhabdus thermomarina]NMX24121.1 DNA internalization-related competence protein ComEC/Rec2 [Dissulfurirhabdus thermomarina]